MTTNHKGNTMMTRISLLTVALVLSSLTASNGTTLLQQLQDAEDKLTYGANYTNAVSITVEPVSQTVTSGATGMPCTSIVVFAATYIQ